MTLDDGVLRGFVDNFVLNEGRESVRPAFILPRLEDLVREAHRVLAEGSQRVLPGVAVLVDDGASVLADGDLSDHIFFYLLLVFGDRVVVLVLLVRDPVADKSLGFDISLDERLDPLYLHDMLSRIQTRGVGFLIRLLQSKLRNSILHT